MKRRRVASLLLLIAGFTVASLLSVSAASPAFEFDIDVTGSRVQVTVDFEPVPVGFAWGSFEASGFLDRLVGLFPADVVDDRGRPVTDTEAIPVSLERREEGIYQGSVLVPEGRWAVVAWPSVPDFDPQASPGAARTAFVEVGGPPAWVWLGVGAFAALLVAVAGTRLSLRRREPADSDAL